MNAAGSGPNHFFFTQCNVELLWELISDEYHLTNAKSKTMREYETGIRSVFDMNLQAFNSKVFDQELMALNKTFLAQINAAVRNLYPDIREHLKKTKIKIIDANTNNSNGTSSGSWTTPRSIEPISHHEIQTKRRSEFNQRLDLQQQNLDMALGVAQKPDEIDLSDQLPTEDKNPQTMAEQYARTLAERKYDLMPSQAKHQKQPKKNITIDERQNQVNEYETQPFDNGSGSDSDTELNLAQPNKNINGNEKNQIMDMLYSITDSLKTVMQDMKLLNEKIDKLD